MRGRAREDKIARLHMQERTSDTNNFNGDGNKPEESNVIQLSYAQYSKIQQKKIDSYTVESMFRSTVPNNMLPLVPKPELIEEPTSTTVSYENHQTDIEFDDQLFDARLRAEQVSKGAQTYKSLLDTQTDL